MSVVGQFDLATIDKSRWADVLVNGYGVATLSKNAVCQFYFPRLWCYVDEFLTWILFWYWFGKMLGSQLAHVASCECCNKSSGVHSSTTHHSLCEQVVTKVMILALLIKMLINWLWKCVNDFFFGKKIGKKSIVLYIYIYIFLK